MARLGGSTVTLTASTDVTVITTGAGVSSIRVRVHNRDTVAHDYPILLGAVEIGRLLAVPTLTSATWGPENVATGLAVKVTAPATTTTASQALVTGEDDN